jgi:hypothetical protein
MQVQPSSHNVNTSKAVGGKHQVGQDAFLAKNTGFRVRDRWAGWDQAPFTSASHSQVAVFEKLP